MTSKRPPHIRFSDEEAVAILKALECGVSVRRMAKKLGCSENTLRGMRDGKTYGWVIKGLGDWKGTVMAKGDLTAEQVKSVLRQAIAGHSGVKIAAWAGCNPETVRRILRGETHIGVTVEGDEKLKARHEKRLAQAKGQGFVSGIEEVFPKRQTLAERQEQAKEAEIVESGLRLLARQAELEAEWAKEKAERENAEAAAVAKAAEAGKMLDFSREALDAEAARLREEEVRRVREEAKREGAGYGD